ncbi:helix-turn-helix domain-containing protein [Marinomonas shanghaiensis]|jgi:AraC-like DNA-binding protein|uniref:helix-turn-helix domain-containing protein n=1 Tax=Marinomonas shanghaiensis TaxID=2202418 RepID=UPI003A8CDF4D
MVTQHSLSLTPAIREVYFGFVKHPAKSTLGPRIQRGIELIYLLSGKIDIVVDGQAHTLLPGHMALQLPQRKEQFFFHREQQTEHSWCQLDFQHCPKELADQLAELPVILPITQEVEQLMELGLNVTNTQTVNNQKILFRLGETLLLYYQAIASLDISARPQPASRIIRAATQYMQNQYTQNIQLEHLAQASHCSVNHLINQFKANFNMTPMRYLWRLRIERSEGLLRHTDLSISLISEQCGFASAFHFSRMFKQKHQLSPSQYRQKNHTTV